jgi:hypothetical protein
MPTFQNVSKAAEELVCSLQLTHEMNKNLSQGQKNLLKFHHALIHIGFSTITKIGELGWLGTKGLQLGDPKVPSPLCASCQYGRGHRRNPEPKTQDSLPSKEKAISHECLNRGDRVYVDRFTVTEKGRLFFSRSYESVDSRYSGDLIFYDAGSSKFVPKTCVSHTANEPAKAKMQYEKHCASYSFLPKAYRTDNGKEFTAQQFLFHLEEQGQKITFSGSGAQHQNGAAESTMIYSIQQELEPEDAPV